MQEFLCRDFQGRITFSSSVFSLSKNIFLPFYLFTVLPFPNILSYANIEAEVEGLIIVVGLDVAAVIEVVSGTRFHIDAQSVGSLVFGASRHDS